MSRTLNSAVRAAIAHDNALADIIPEAWAATYHCTTEDVKAAWETELSARSIAPLNTYEVEGK